MNFKGKAKRLDDIDLPMIGRENGLGEDEIRALLDVEAAGSGFDRQGRPKMLFEPHVYWRQLGPGAKRDRAAREGLAYPRWKPGAYPRDSYPRLLKAMAIDEEAALRSASWGLPQIMGFNAEAAGYPSAAAMVASFVDDEEHHLRAMIRFIKHAKLDDELRRRDWKGFARGYNGPGFAKNGYDRKLAAAFAKWQRIKDTPIPATIPESRTVAPKRVAAVPVKAGAPKPGKTPPVRKAIAAAPATSPGTPAAGVVAILLGSSAGGAFAAWTWLSGKMAQAVDFIIFWN